MYKNLSKYYDDLLVDDESIIKWYKFVSKFCKEKDILELACGSGELANCLYKKGYKIIASDISLDMLECLKYKYPYIETKRIDMKKFKFDKKISNIICFCDSINYLSDLKECETVFKNCFKTLKNNGIFLFDIHSEYRLKEFKNGYFEDGYLDDIYYKWNIKANNFKLVHNFEFYSENGLIKEEHIQTVFKYKDIKNILNKVGFKTEIYSDFINSGIIENSEKIFFVCRKEI